MNFKTQISHIVLFLVPFLKLKSTLDFGRIEKFSWRTRFVKIGIRGCQKTIKRNGSLAIQMRKCDDFVIPVEAGEKF